MFEMPIVHGTCIHRIFNLIQFLSYFQVHALYGFFVLCQSLPFHEADCRGGYSCIKIILYTDVRYFCKKNSYIITLFISITMLCGIFSVLHNIFSHIQYECGAHLHHFVSLIDHCYESMSNVIHS